LQACAGAVREAHVHVKAAVEPAVLLRALPPGWTLDAPRSLMAATRPLAPQPLPAGYHAIDAIEHGTRVLHLLDEHGSSAATGRLHLQQGCAVFDRIETDPAHRRRGLARAVMGLLDRGAVEAGAQERLLVASEQGRALYLALGWQVLAPYATAISPQTPATVY
jgi:GNAT superfamily N-acetyltransferase